MQVWPRARAGRVVGAFADVAAGEQGVEDWPTRFSREIHPPQSAYGAERLPKQGHSVCSMLLWSAMSGQGGFQSEESMSQWSASHQVEGKPYPHASHVILELI